MEFHEVLCRKENVVARFEPTADMADVESNSRILNFELFTSL